jgi:hypothetical protein
MYPRGQVASGDVSQAAERFGCTFWERRVAGQAGT